MNLLFPERLGSTLRGWMLRQARHALGVTVHTCGRSGCRRIALAHRRMRRDGIFLEELWLCSPSCLEAALAERIEDLRRPAPAVPLRLPRMPFRLRLLQAGAISETELARAQSHAEGAGITLLRALRELGSAEDEHIAASLAAESGCAFFKLPPSRIEPIFRVPGAVADACEAATVYMTPDRIVVGFVSRIDRQLLSVVKAMTGLRAEGCFLTPARLQAQRSFDGVSQTGPVVSRPIETIVRELLGAAVAAGAEHVSLRGVRGLIWAKLCSGNGNRHDHIFALADEMASIPHCEAHLTAMGEKKARAL